MRNLQEKAIEELSRAPFDMAVLRVFLSRYAQPVRKAWALVNKGVLLRLKKGFFCVSPEYAHRFPDLNKVANVLYAPSYVSFETVLARCGLIPEAVIETSSAVTGRAKRFETPLGRFSYRTVPNDVFPIGVRSVGGALVASPEKALCDLLDSKSGLRISSPRSLRSYLECDLRFDFDAFGKPNMEILAAYAAAGRKKPLFRALERLFQ